MAKFRLLLLTAVVATLPLLATPKSAEAQRCVGKRPGGGRWVASAELYLDRARRPTSPQDRNERYQQALDASQQGWVAQPNNPRNYELAGRAFVGLRDYAGADSAFSKAEAIWSCYAAKMDTLRYNAWREAFNRAVTYSQRGNEDQAIVEYRNAWTVYGKLPHPMIQLGNVYANRALQAETEEVRSEWQEEAITSLRKAIAAMNASPARLSDSDRQEFGRAAAFNLAQLLAMEERYEQSAQAYEAFLSQEPDNVAAISNAAVVITRASQQLRRDASDLEDGTQKDALEAKSDSLEAVAIGYYENLLAREDLSADDYHNVGVGLNQVGNYAEATDAFGKALALEPYRLNSLEQVALAFFRGEHYDTLAVVAQTLVDRYPLDLNHLALLANAFRELDDTDKALEILQRREALTAEVTDLELVPEEGGYKITGRFTNLGLEPNSAFSLQFDFFDAAGERVASETVSVTAPAVESAADFSVTTASTVSIAGFTYQPVSAQGT